MRIWGKIFGALFGFAAGRFVGLIIGLWLGHRFDKALERHALVGLFQSPGSQKQFLITTFAVMGHVAKANGKVSQQEIQVASILMDRMGLRGEIRDEAQQAFNQGKESDYPLEEKIEVLVALVKGRHDLLQMFLEVQLQSAFADGEVDSAEREVLGRVASSLGFDEQVLDSLIARWEAEFKFHQQHGRQQTAADSASALKQAYQILDVAESDTDQQVKRAHRKLMSQHHPDKLVAKGLPPEMMEIANQKAQDIQQAYELIKKQRGMR
ncbi:co-chaperone DjlA [Alginatibacterium sediminis]|uniref:Co-chaperone protein DjlA n=1 Tax=Alginatibacterium sediminis TaxID=2164068 RepID=A0A420E801_9ALTE|nr:co-chaperone DjlA [Alginatibacterium sediminis]RKF14545.1 co-chaperone DjlA [Alginatibacterium sediminis]